jgi:hypothetical protein
MLRDFIYITVIIVGFWLLRSTMLTIAEDMRNRYLKVQQVEKMVELLTTNRDLLGDIRHELKRAREEDEHQRTMKLMGKIAQEQRERERMKLHRGGDASDLA